MTRSTRFHWQVAAVLAVLVGLVLELGPSGLDQRRVAVLAILGLGCVVMELYDVGFFAPRRPSRGRDLR